MQEVSESDAVAVHGMPDVVGSSCSSAGPELTDAHLLALLPLHGLTHLSLGGLRAVQVCVGDCVGIPTQVWVANREGGELHGCKRIIEEAGHGADLLM